jgi:hypothetical protein
MATSAKLDVEATEQRVNVRSPEQVSQEDDVEVPEREPQGQVSQPATIERGQIDHRDEADRADACTRVATSPEEGGIHAFNTECGVMLYFPCEVDPHQLDISLVDDRDNLRLEDHGWKVRLAGDRAVECLPTTREAVASGKLQLAVNYSSAGHPRHETLQITLGGGQGQYATARSAASAPFASASAGSSGSSGGGSGTAGGGSGGGGSGSAGAGSAGGGRGSAGGSGGRGAGGGRRSDGGPGSGNGGNDGNGGNGGSDGNSGDFLANLFKVPLRVRDGVVSGAGGEDLEAWRDTIVETVFPRLAHRPDPFQFRESLAELAGPPAGPSPYQGGALAFAGVPIGGGAPGWPFGANAGSGVDGGVPSGPSGDATYGQQGGQAMLQRWSAGYIGRSAYRPNAGGTATTLAASQLAGPFADLASVANALELNALPAARDLGALTQDADLDELEAERAIVEDALTSLIAELRQPPPDGPDRSIAQSLSQRLTAHLGRLGDAAQITTTVPAGANAVTPADYANVSRFEVLDQWATIAGEAVAAFDPAGADPRAGIGRVKQLLGVVVEKTRELELELDIADVGPLERGRFEVSPVPTSPPGAATTGPITLARLLGWLQEQAGRHLPRLLDSSGALASQSVVDTLSDQLVYVEELAGQDTFPFNHPIVQRVVDGLAQFLTRAIEEAETL